MLFPQGIEAMGRGWPACLVMAPFRPRPGGPELPGISCVSIREPLAFSGQWHWDQRLLNLRGCFGKEGGKAKKVELPSFTEMILLCYLICPSRHPSKVGTVFSLYG